MNFNRLCFIFWSFTSVFKLNLLHELFEQVLIEVLAKAFGQRAELCTGRCDRLFAGNTAKYKFYLPNNSIWQLELNCAFLVGLTRIQWIGQVGHMLTPLSRKCGVCAICGTLLKWKLVSWMKIRFKNVKDTTNFKINVQN